MLVSAIISKFESYTDDATELSSSEELALLNEKYRFILSERPWNFLKKEATGTTSISVPYVALPSDFAYILANYQNTGITQNNDTGKAPVVVFVGSDFTPYQVINWSDRRQYRDADGYCYIDPVTSRLYFTKQPTTAKAIEYDYIYRVADLTTSSTPLFPEEFQPLLYLLMAMDDDIIQKSEKSRSYIGENSQKAKMLMDKMALWDAQLFLN